MDIAAGRLGLDPVELRRRNFITPGEMPYEVGGDSLGQRTVYDCGDYRSALDQALEAVGYERPEPSRPGPAARDATWASASACLVEKAGLGPWEYARVEVDATGHVVVYSGLASVGQGIETTLAQVCADELAWRRRPSPWSMATAARIPFGVGGFASRGASVGASGRDGGCPEGPGEDRSTGRRAPGGGCRRISCVDGGAVHVRGAPDRRVSFRELARAAVPGPPGMEPGLQASHFFEAPKMTYPYGTHVAMVEVDPETGQVRLLRYAIAYDVGRAVNPMIVDGQLVGALAQGIGGALLEELVYDDAGQLLTTTFMDYLMPTAIEMPESTAIRILEETPTPLNPLGVKGVGEGGSSGCGGAIANAIGRRACAARRHHQ